jgi:hypothetical protein
MRLSSPILGGLVVKVREPRKTARENRKKWLKRVAATEALLRPYSLNAWRKTIWNAEQAAKTSSTGRIAADTVRRKGLGLKPANPAGK